MKTRLENCVSLFLQFLSDCMVLLIILFQNELNFLPCWEYQAHTSDFSHQHLLKKWVRNSKHGETIEASILRIFSWSFIKPRSNSYSSISSRSQGSSNSSEGVALDSGVHLTILRTKSRKPFLLEPSRFLSATSQDTGRTGFRHFQLPNVYILDYRTHILGINGLPLSSK